VRVRIAVIENQNFGPRQLDALISQLLLKTAAAIVVSRHLARRDIASKAEKNKEPGRFSNLSFHRVQARTAVGNTGRAEVLAEGSKATRA
jgi:hypothetical protein